MACGLPEFEDMDWSPDLQEKREREVTKKKDGFSELEKTPFVRLDEFSWNEEIVDYIHDTPW